MARSRRRRPRRPTVPPPAAGSRPRAPRSPRRDPQPRPAEPAPRRPPGRRRLLLPAGLLLAAAAVALLLTRGGRPDLPDLPAPDLAAMEPEVAAAVERARDRVRDEPGSAERWAAYGAVLLAHELEAPAAAAYRAAGDLAPDNHRHAYLEARSLWSDDPAAAETAVRRALSLEPEYAPALLLAGQLAEERDDPETAAADYRAVLDRSAAGAPSNRASANFRLGRLLAADGDPEAALPLLERAEELAPQSGAVAAALARLHRRLGDEPRARAAAERARSLEHDLAISDPLMDAVNALSVSVVGRESRARAAEGAGRPRAAEALLRDMIRSRPDSADLHYNLGNNLSRQGRNDEALAAWADALARNPSHVAALVNSSIVLAQSGDLAEAERRCRRVLEIEPNHPGALSSLGSITALAGRRGEALRWFRRALAEEPERAGTHDSIAQVLAAERQFDEAIRHYRIAVAKEPLRSDYRLGLAAVFASLGRFGDSWAVVHEGRRLGVNLPADFLGMLADAMPDPGSR